MTNPSSTPFARTFSFHDIGSHELLADERDCHDDMTPAEIAEYFLSEMRPTTDARLRAGGIVIDREKQNLTVIDDCSLRRAYALCQMVDDAYETLPADDFTIHYGCEPAYWWSNTMGFGGDDDVDYNSSYITIVLDAVRVMYAAALPEGSAVRNAVERMM